MILVVALEHGAPTGFDAVRSFRQSYADSGGKQLGFSASTSAIDFEPMARSSVR